MQRDYRGLSVTKLGSVSDLTKAFGNATSGDTWTDPGGDTQFGFGSIDGVTVPT